MTNEKREKAEKQVLESLGAEFTGQKDGRIFRVSFRSCEDSLWIGSGAGERAWDLLVSLQARLNELEKGIKS